VPLTNGRFLSRQLLDRVGPFDERYSAISDRQFFLPSSRPVSTRSISA
jgi:hypothetical protein